MAETKDTYAVDRSKSISDKPCVVKPSGGKGSVDFLIWRGRHTFENYSQLVRIYPNRTGFLRSPALDGVPIQGRNEYGSVVHPSYSDWDKWFTGKY